MNRYRQLTSEERHTLSTLRKQGYQQAAIARALGRHRSTISREDSGILLIQSASGRSKGLTQRGAPREEDPPGPSSMQLN